MGFSNLGKLDLSRSRPDKLIPSVTCADGFWISIQGHDGAYSKPSDICYLIYQYDQMEIKVSAEVPELKKYQDGEGSTIYGYVPIELIENLLVTHGGIA